MSTALVTRPMFYGDIDPITLNRMESLVANVTTLQRERISSLSRIDRRRDLDKECGYPETELTAEEYKELIDREPAAALVNDFYPLESWKVTPWLYETSDSDEDTEFEEAVANLPRMLGIEPTHMRQDMTYLTWGFLLNADMLMGYGRHGVILYDFVDGKEWSEPVTPKKNMALRGLYTFPEHLAQVSSFEMDRESPRYGLPTQYMVRFGDYLDVSNTGIMEPHETVYVHWSRVAHLVDRWHTASPSKVFGKPRVSPVRDPVLDIRKLRGSSAEMFYKGGFGGHHFGTHPQLGPDVDVDRDKMRDMYEEFINGLQRAIFTNGMTVDSLAPDLSDPTPYIAIQMEAIALKTRTPKRILLGSERGELSSSDDRKNHNSHLASRHNTFLSPYLIAPFYDRLINVGVLPTPKEGYIVEWPSLESLNETEKADILSKRTTSYAAYVSGGVDNIVPPKDYMTKFDDMTDEEADEILDRAVEANEGMGDAPAALLGLVGGVTSMLDMFDKFSNGAISEETLTQLIMLFYKVDEAKAAEIIADGLPNAPEGSSRDKNIQAAKLPALPPMKGPKAPASVRNWYVENVLKTDKEVVSDV